MAMTTDPKLTAMAIDAIKDHAEREHRSIILRDLRRNVVAAEKEFARMEARVDGKVVWYPRTEAPPAGQIWASDGAFVWLIATDGKGIGDSAVSVKWWTQANIPAPPKT